MNSIVILLSLKIINFIDSVSIIPSNKLGLYDLIIRINEFQFLTFYLLEK